MHVKIIFAGSKAKVYIDSDEPVLHIDNLKRDETGGGLGVHSANFSSVHFANFEFTTLADAYQFPATEPESAGTTEGLVTSWQVSDAFDGASLEGRAKLGAEHKTNRTWTSLDAESTGITNLARVNGLGESSNTVFARIVVTAEQAGIRQLMLGYSDAAAVFVNDTLAYKGNNGYLTRDYRYLGTIGLFDSVALPLQAGENEIWIAVSEAFGGWGIMAAITDLN